MEARNIKTKPNNLTANIKGIIDAPDGVLKITEIISDFMIKVENEEQKQVVERIFPVFPKYCPVAQTLEGAVKFTYNLQVTLK
ncbi:hypothetical protein CIB95_07815 [Lottiidibacillus patelloidae]|uniref:Uncharacterized protein n=1 Tax=Lottiidibacillus patelloidae TaxID=2670334 RepID=A0A263BUF7_9BACI|nr:hypothetical protein CIB95_07815 [Lottiidibacillus patelloidae]